MRFDRQLNKIIGKCNVTENLPEHEVNPDFELVDDMILHPDQYDILYNTIGRRTGRTQTVRIWPNATVPYYLDNNFSKIDFLSISVNHFNKLSSISRSRENFDSICSEHHSEGFLRQVRSGSGRLQGQELHSHHAGSWMCIDSWILGWSPNYLFAKSGKNYSSAPKLFSSDFSSTNLRVAWRSVGFSMSLCML